MNINSALDREKIPTDALVRAYRQASGSWRNTATPCFKANFDNFFLVQRNIIVICWQEKWGSESNGMVYMLTCMKHEATLAEQQTKSMRASS